MRRPSLRAVFRSLVIASFILPFIGVGYEFAVTSELSADEQVLLQWSGHSGVFESISDDETFGGDVAVGIGIIALLLGLLAVQIGLYCFRYWARTWWVITAIVFLPASLFFGWNISLPFTQFCFDVSMAMSGGILALIYASPLSHSFARNPSPPVTVASV